MIFIPDHFIIDTIQHSGISISFEETKKSLIQ